MSTPAGAQRFLHTSARLQAEAGRQAHKYAKPSRVSMPVSQDSEQAPVPVSLWDHPLYRIANRKPHQAMPSTAGDTSGPGSEIRRPTMSQRQTYRAMMLDFRANAPTVLGGAQKPTVRYAPPIAVPADAKISGTSTASLRDRLKQLKDLHKEQVSKGDYAPYLPKASLHDQRLRSAEATKSPESRAIVIADQALSANTSMHPIARRFIIERLGSQLKVPC
ncbi:hypothetical protein MBRA1_002045 [Malassezia brasiliensis]|uniref:Uncharacterized protein n=1 Tax=Malassezia brasiliensis TaxID=1821822 RepID=A0AAF0DU01_9BASI|nr:hypothetical protein MBRA1_002045 [Malassezia brasiliensis]